MKKIKVWRFKSPGSKTNILTTDNPISALKILNWIENKGCNIVCEEYNIFIDSDEDIEKKFNKFKRDEISLSVLQDKNRARKYYNERLKICKNEIWKWRLTNPSVHLKMAKIKCKEILTFYDNKIKHYKI